MFLVYFYHFRMHLDVYIALECSFVCIGGVIAHLRSLGQNRKVILAIYRVCSQFENHQESGDHYANTRVLSLGTIKSSGVNSRGRSCKFNSVGVKK